jgi:hypothetical protein
VLGFSVTLEAKVHTPPEIVVASATKPGVELLNPDGRPSYTCVSK